MPTTPRHAASRALILTLVGLSALLAAALTAAAGYALLRSVQRDQEQVLVAARDKLLSLPERGGADRASEVLRELIETVESAKDQVAEDIGSAADDEVMVTPEVEAEIGAALHQRILATGKTIDDRRMFDRVSTALQRVLDVAPVEFRVVHLTLLDDDAVNAFAAPGGYVYVARGLVDAIGDDDEQLLFVLGHEIGHVRLGHTRRAIALRVLTSELPVPGALGDAVASQLTLAYSEAQEFAADQHACETLWRLQIDRKAGVRVMRTLEGAEHDSPADRRQSKDDRPAIGAAVDALRRHFETHPPCAARIARIEAWRPPSR